MNPTTADPPLDLLAFGAHPDDVELCCGGLLAASAARGYRTGIVDLSRGELGSSGTPELRAAEAARAGADPGPGGAGEPGPARRLDQPRRRLRSVTRGSGRPFPAGEAWWR